MAVTTTSLAVKDANNASQSLSVSTDPAGLLSYNMSLDRAGIAAYRVSASFTPFATAAITVLSIQGSATKTVRITKIMIGGTSTASGSTLLQLIRSTALGTGGTAVTPSTAKMDSGTVAAPTAVVKQYTTAAQVCRHQHQHRFHVLSDGAGRDIVAAPTTSGIPQPFLLYPGRWIWFTAQAIVLSQRRRLSPKSGRAAAATCRPVPSTSTRWSGPRTRAGPQLNS